MKNIRKIDTGWVFKHFGYDSNGVIDKIVFSNNKVSFTPGTFVSCTQLPDLNGVLYDEFFNVVSREYFQGHLIYGIVYKHVSARSFLIEEYNLYAVEDRIPHMEFWNSLDDLKIDLAVKPVFEILESSHGINLDV